jgi:UDP-N-acetylmuramoyl-tripeptide--D-alanyl-D-alanine ligase
MATPIPSNSARFSLDEIVRATRGTIERRGPVAVASVTSDSRAVTEGALFVALHGETHDGHAFVSKAVDQGAAVLVVDRSVDVGGEASIVRVDDTLVAWGDLARAHLERWRGKGERCRVVAITGSAGKTTTKELTAALLACVAPTHFTAGNLNNRIGVPAVVFGLTDEHRFAVLEMGMSLPGELDAIASFARPDVSVVVNVGVAHSEGVGGIDGVMREKGAVYRALSAGGVAIVNVDDPYVRRAAEDAHVPTMRTFGRAPADLRLQGRTPSASGSHIVLARAGVEIGIELPIPGEAAAIDLAAAIAAQEAASGVVLEPGAIEAALAGVTMEGRGTVRRAGDLLILDDTYNANPASMRAALLTLAELAGSRRRVAVLGEMRELGALAEEEHDRLGDAVAAAGVALLVGCGGLVERTLARAGARGVEIVRADGAEAAAVALIARARPGDVILVKASRGVRAERVVKALCDHA